MWMTIAFPELLQALAEILYIKYLRFAQQMLSPHFLPNETSSAVDVSFFMKLALPLRVA